MNNFANIEFINFDSFTNDDTFNIMKEFENDLNMNDMMDDKYNSDFQKFDNIAKDKNYIDNNSRSIEYIQISKTEKNPSFKTPIFEIKKNDDKEFMCLTC